MLTRIAAPSLVVGLLAGCGPASPATTATTPTSTAVAIAVASADASVLGSVFAAGYVRVTADGLYAGALDPEASRGGVDLNEVSGEAIELDDLAVKVDAWLNPGDDEPGEMGGGFGYGGMGHGPAGCSVAMHRVGDDDPTVLLIAAATVPASRVALVIASLDNSVALVAYADDATQGRPLAMVVDSDMLPFASAAVLTIGAGTAQLTIEDSAAAARWSEVTADAITETIASLVEGRPDILAQVSIRIDDGATAQDLVTAIAGLTAAEVQEILLLDVPGDCIGHLGAIGLSDLGATDDAEPAVRIGQPAVTGDLDKAIIRRYIRRNIAKIKYCYEKHLLVSPSLQGTATADFTIEPSGAVSTATVKGFDPDVDACLQQVLLGIEFPAPTSGGSVNVSYPFTFRTGT